MPLDLNGHSTTIQTDSAYKLRNNIIAKAGDMIFYGNGIPKDTLNSFYYHFQYPLNYSLEQKRKYSLLYFRVIKDTFNLLTSETSENKYSIAINPYMLSETSVLQKIATSINKYGLNKNKIIITLIKGDIPLSEEGQSMLYSSLEKVRELIKLNGAKPEIETNVNLDENKVAKILNGFSFPIYSIYIY